jgi:signal peptidase II
LVHDARQQLAVAVVLRRLLDQTTKALVIGTVKTQDTIALLPFQRRLPENTGSVQHLRPGVGLAALVFHWAGASSASLMLWLRRIRAEQTLLAIGLSLVLGGALGNVIDRVMHGYVVDFIYFNWHTGDFRIQHRRYRHLDRCGLPAAGCFS